MTGYVALLRAIGPATHAKMPLIQLAEACARAGLTDAANVGNTGNIVFRSDRSQAEVERIVTVAVAGFGLGNEVFTRTSRQLRKLIDFDPFPEASATRPDRVTACFFHRDPRWPQAYVDYSGRERLRTISNHLVIDYGKEIAVSRLTIEKTVGARMTQRNWSSILRIAAALGA